jgi:phosphoglycolate phosphatase
LSPAMNKLAVFDCDGTLVDSGATIFAALSDAFMEHDVEVPSPEISRKVIGLSLVEAIATLTPGEEYDRHVTLAESYKRHFQRARAEGRVEEPLFDGIPELLDALEGDGWLLAVATGKSDRGLSLCLDCHGFSKRFMSLQTADRHPSKPHPSMVRQAMADAGSSPETTIVVGDTAFDMGMAVAAGATGIGAGWGYHEAHELLDGGALAVAHEPLDVLKLLPAISERRYG